MMLNLQQIQETSLKVQKITDKYSLNTLFYYTIKNAWVVNHTIKTVDRELNNTHVYINKRAAQKTGKLFDATIYKANKANPEFITLSKLKTVVC